MPAFKGTLSAKQIQDVAAFVFASTHAYASRRKRPQKGETRPGEGRESPQFTSVAGYQGEPARRIVLKTPGRRHRPEG